MRDKKFNNTSKTENILWRARTLNFHGNSTKAIWMLTNFVAANPDERNNPAILRSLAHCHQVSHKYQEAIHYVEKLI